MLLDYRGEPNMITAVLIKGGRRIRVLEEIRMEAEVQEKEKHAALWL